MDQDLRLFPSNKMQRRNTNHVKTVKDKHIAVTIAAIAAIAAVNADLKFDCHCCIAYEGKYATDQM